MAQKDEKWTRTAIDCYKRGGVCSGCYFENYFTCHICQMRKCIIKLVKKLGKPKGIRLQQVLED